ncbi:MAG: Stp1/IreP family PP2C-type Ser/Thr phosphatase [Selenomonadaceae bacterium]|nr:Stp1/IreP family PP2C-type Ser/Thr phosphatase [Selenomonadaceae bacterium]
MSKIFQATHVGKVRKNNEDSLIVIEPETFVTADGMGGQAAGEVASKILVETVKNFLPLVPEPWNEEILSKSIRKANAKVLQAANENKNYRGMGTTATILHIYKNRAYYAHIGDSRIYRVRNKILEQITEDHSYVESLVRRGEITPEQARVHPMKNILTQAVGADENITVDSGNFRVDFDDIFLLCTDGLTNMVEDENILKILLESSNPADDLIQAALDGGGHDNISVIVVKVGE